MAQYAQTRSGGIFSFSFTGTHEFQPFNGYVFLLNSFLHAELVALEELHAGVPRVLPLEELLGEPAVEALVILALQLRAGLPHAVHGGAAGPG